MINDYIDKIFQEPEDVSGIGSVFDFVVVACNVFSTLYNEPSLFTPAQIVLGLPSAPVWTLTVNS